MMKAMALALLLSASVASADTRFTPVDGLESRLQSVLAHEEQAFFSFITDDEPCGAVFISHRGDLLTARHCLQHCLFTHNLLLEKHDGQATYYIVDRARLGHSTCDVQIDGVNRRVVIEATSPGLIFTMDELSFSVLTPDHYRQLVAQGYTGRGDFVIARLLDQSQPTACVPLADHAAAPGESVHTFSRPTATQRPDGYNSDGHSLYYSAGQALKSIYDNSCVQSLPLTSYIQDKLDHLLSPVNFLSTLDATYGSSGSPVLSQTGRLVGVLTNVYRHASNTHQDSDEPQNRYCAGSAIALDIEQIRRLAEASGLDPQSLVCEPSLTPQGAASSPTPGASSTVD